MKMTLKELCGATGGHILKGSPEITACHITTASNVIKGDDLFIPIKGERTDGHKYIGSAFANGAAVSLTEYENTDGVPEGKGLILCKDNVKALQDIAGYCRKKYIKIPCVGITGSVGKTTTREVTSKALSGGLRVYTTKGNANSQIGLPVTVAETDPDAQIAVYELGISEFGEMEIISDIASVDTACITNIGVSHIAQFGTQQNILREKLNIIKNLPDGGFLFVNGDDPILKELTEERIHDMGLMTGKRVNIRTFGLSETCDVYAADIEKKDGCFSFTAVFNDNGENVRVSLSVPGEHMIGNALCALSVCRLYNVPLEKAAECLNSYKNFEGRGNIIERAGVRFINDCYNASPVSMKAGLKVLSDMDTKGRRIAVLADMKELGENEKEYHKEIGRFIKDNVPDLSVLFTFGELSEHISEEAAYPGIPVIRHFTDIEELKKELFATLTEGDLCFIKGSNSMGLSRILN